MAATDRPGDRSGTGKGAGKGSGTGKGAGKGSGTGKGNRPASRPKQAGKSGGRQPPAAPGRPAFTEAAFPEVTFTEAALTEEAAIELLTAGELEVAGRLVEASNATLYCMVSHGGTQAACVYKPVAGERPLWDFPNGTLAGREVAAYQVSHASGWGIVPPTVYRDGPFGPGMCQLWIDSDPEIDLVALARSSSNDGLRAMAVFDAVINNADRKIGHLLPTPQGHLYGCDHGVSFAEEYKLRTVLWQWRGDPIADADMDALSRLGEVIHDGELASQLRELLTEDEINATRIRVELLLTHRVHPYPPEDWPAVPWPPI